MRYFALLDFQHMVLGFFIGLASAIVVYMVWGSYTHRRQIRTEEELIRLEHHEMSIAHKPAHNPIAPVLIFAYVLVLIWVVAYWIVVGVRGGPIG